MNKNSLLVIPSIDIQGGKTVRVVKGIPELNCSEYGNDPVEMAMIWRAENAKCIHVVDFDAARKHSSENKEIIREMCESVIIPVQLGGGIRSLEDADEAMELGAFRLVIGTLAFTRPDEFRKILYKYGAQRITAAMDVIDNNVVINSRQESTGVNALEYAGKLKSMGVNRIVVTDVNKNGMMTGPNIGLSKQVAEVTGAKVTLSGGVSGYQDLKNIKNFLYLGIDSVIVGRALYENTFPCQRMWRYAESGVFN